MWTDRTGGCGVDAKRWDFGGVGQVGVEGLDRWVWRMWRDGESGCGGMGQEDVYVE